MIGQNRFQPRIIYHFQQNDNQQVVLKQAGKIGEISVRSVRSLKVIVQAPTMYNVRYATDPAGYQEISQASN